MPHSVVKWNTRWKWQSVWEQADNPFLLVCEAALAERSGEGLRMAVAIHDPGEVAIVWVKFDAVCVPHREVASSCSRGRGGELHDPTSIHREDRAH